jgi:mRNA-degrading endonuclease RelE of RelBE toxin-antitoxin system
VKTFSDVARLPEFEKDLKKLLKRFKTLEDDLDIFIRTELNLYHKLRKDSGGIFRLTGLAGEEPKIYKAKKFACRSLRGKGVQSGIRIIYAYYEERDSVELIEIYYKGDKATEDRERLARMYRQDGGKAR